jgi:hypothetical protein
MNPASTPDYVRALELVLGKDALEGHDPNALSRLDPAAMKRLLSDNGYREAIEAMAEHARTFTVVMPAYEPLAAWLASYAWGYGHHICIARWGPDTASILEMMGRYTSQMRSGHRPVLMLATLTLYRGQLAGAPLGWSWTLERDWAETFLREWNRPGEVLELTLAADKVLAVICDHADGEGHDEFVVDPGFACRHFPAYQPLDTARARALVEEDFPARSDSIPPTR